MENSLTPGYRANGDYHINDDLPSDVKQVKKLVKMGNMYTVSNGHHGAPLYEICYLNPTKTFKSYGQLDRQMDGQNLNTPLPWDKEHKIVK